jgi:hypothetical protein
MEVEVECWENQRYVMFKGWGPYRLPVDRPLWSNKKGNETCCKQSTLLPGGWTWTGDWSVAPFEKSDDGWYYAPDFTIPTRFCSSKPSGLAIVRRRKWRRTRVQLTAATTGVAPAGSASDASNVNTWIQTLFYGFYGAGVEEQRNEQLRSHLSYYRLSSMAAKVSGLAGVAVGLGQAAVEIIDDDSPTAGEVSEDLPPSSSGGSPLASITSKQMYHIYKYGLANVLRATLWPHWLGVPAKRAAYPRSTFAEYSQAAAQSGESFPAYNEIAQDVVRTAPRHPFFDGRGSHGAMCLTNTLLAVTLVPGMAEYHQAFSYVAAVLLLNMPHEDAFWSMICVIDNILPKGFHEQYHLQLDLRIFAEIFAEKFPDLEAHFQARQIDLSVFATGWVQGLFCAHFPFAAASRFFDVMFAEGNSSMLVRVLHAFVKMKYEMLRTMDSSCSLGQFANDWARQQFDVEGLVAICAKDGLGQTVLKRRAALMAART